VDLKALSKQASRPFPTIEELRALPILYVLERAGYGHEDRDGVYTTKSPFRPDNHPSFDVFGPKLERWGDFAEGVTGDVLDLLKRFAPDRRFVEIKDWAARLLRECEESGWSGPTEGVMRQQFDLETARRFVNGVLTNTNSGADMYIHEWLMNDRDDYLHSNVSASWLIYTFKLGWGGGRIIIPYINRYGRLRWYKTRYPGGPVRAASGTGYDSIFYGEHLDTGDKTVVLCEGESDVWSGTHAAGQDFVFLGLPTGAGTLPNGLAETLIDRRVILAFDGDDAGRTATARWADYLEATGCTTRILPLTNGRDLATLSGEHIRSDLYSTVNW
jgi:hypothetical protein